MKKILQASRNCVGLYEIERSGLLVDGRSYYLAFYRAALKAKRYILICGWQFDSNVTLIRGDDAKKTEGEVRFLPFLNSLCDKNPDLEVYILAWDFNLLYSLDRELLQEWLFNWTSNDRIRFLFDNRHAIGASHHQKFVVVDGVIGFIGGMDICSSRWDTRQHLPGDPLRRNPAGNEYEQYHDIQSYHSGPIVEKLKDIFLARWEHAGGPDILLPHIGDPSSFEVSSSVNIEAGTAALSRTQSKSLFPAQKDIREIRSLYLDAIDAAEELIYIENQYFSSQAVYKALMDRLKTSERTPLQIVIILPKQPHSLLENIALGIAQAKMLQSMKVHAKRYGHSLGIYFTAQRSSTGLRIPTYIHSKLLLIDDRFLSIGSANTNNRSMGLDTELNISWEAASDKQQKLVESIRRARVNLLAEHCGIHQEGDTEMLHNIDGLVDLLNRLADDPGYSLQHHTMESFIENIDLLKDLNVEDLALDPERPIVEENIYDIISADKTGFFAEGISWLNDYLKTATKRRIRSLMKREKERMFLRIREGASPFTGVYKTAYILRARWRMTMLILLFCAFMLWLVLR